MQQLQRVTRGRRTADTVSIPLAVKTESIGIPGKDQHWACLAQYWLARRWLRLSQRTAVSRNRQLCSRAPPLFPAGSGSQPSALRGVDAEVTAQKRSDCPKERLRLSAFRERIYGTDNGHIASNLHWRRSVGARPTNFAYSRPAAVGGLSDGGGI